MPALGAGVLTLLYLVLPLVQSLVFLEGQPFADPLDVANFAGSIFAYHWLLNNVLLGLKIPVLQRVLPYDLRVRTHVWATFGLLAFVGWHGFYTIFLKVKDIDLVTWTLLGVLVLMVVVSLLWIPVPPFVRLRTLVLARTRSVVLTSYDALKTVHKGLFLALAALTWWHILLAELDGLVPAWSGALYHGHWVLAALATVGQRVANRFLPRLTLRRVEDLGGLVRLVFEPHRRLVYRPGQFAFLRFDAPGLRGEEHPFSFTSTPREGEVAFAIRALGDFTARLTQLKPGDTVRINGGFGAFAPRARSQRPLVLIGSGIGIAPLVSLLKDLDAQATDRPVTAFLAVDRAVELFEIETLRALFERHPDWRLHTFVKETDPTLYDATLFRQRIDHVAEAEYLVCSSARVRTLVVQALVSLGVRRSRIGYEAFSLGSV